MIDAKTDQLLRLCYTRQGVYNILNYLFKSANLTNTSSLLQKTQVPIPSLCSVLMSAACRCYSARFVAMVVGAVGFGPMLAVAPANRLAC
jgi:hypothetical protein